MKIIETPLSEQLLYLVSSWSQHLVQKYTLIATPKLATIYLGMNMILAWIKVPNKIPSN